MAFWLGGGSAPFAIIPPVVPPPVSTGGRGIPERYRKELNEERELTQEDEALVLLLAVALWEYY